MLQQTESFNNKQNSYFIELQGRKVHYWESHPEMKPTILMLHGFRSSHEGLLKLAREFSHYHLIIPDFPGYGLTDELTGNHSVLAYAEFVADFVRALQLTNITVLGHSFGALVGLI